VCAPGDPLGCRILALGGTEDRQVAVAELAAWREQTSSTCDTQLFEGGHFFVNDAAVDVAAYLTEMILAAPTGRDRLEMTT
jgi:surfactin synthase thioesterase subunit